MKSSSNHTLMSEIPIKIYFVCEVIFHFPRSSDSSHYKQNATNACSHLWFCFAFVLRTWKIILKPSVNRHRKMGVGIFLRFLHLQYWRAYHHKHNHGPNMYLFRNLAGVGQRMVLVARISNTPHSDA